LKAIVADELLNAQQVNEEQAIMKSLILAQLPKLKTLDCSDNLLTELVLKNLLF
jgi:Leucine-rich repeat (LRR) protein